MATWLLNSIEIAGGFLDGLDVRLPAGPGLICIIGPRGSGKSTLAEAIRYAMGGGYAGNKQRQDLLQENIGSAVITLRATADVAASEYVISRRFRQPPSVVTQDGRALPGVDLERGTFLPIDAYSSLEIESIADESLGDKRRMLVDELQGPEYRQLLLSLGSHRRALEANADAVKNARRRVADLTERIEEIGDVETRISMMPAPPKDQGSDLLARLTNQQHLNGREASALAKVIRLQTDLVLDLNRVVDAHERSLTATLALPRSLNALTVDRVEIIARDAVNQVRRSLEEGSAALARSDASLQVISAELASAHNAQEQEFRDLTAKNSEVSKIVEERATVEQSLATLVGLRADRAEASRQVEGLIEERAALKGLYLLERERVSVARETIAARLESNAGGRVRVRINRNADNLSYRRFLLDGIKGARVRNHDEIIESLLQLRPESLAEIIYENALNEFEQQTSFGHERSRKILDSLRASVDHFALEVVDVEDRISIELNVGTEDEPNMRDASDLSRGQKCTALLPLLLARRDTPLLIDQPEDNLDNRFIYETVVETIVRLKRQRQLIFVTHNANIPVLGEADLVVVMGSDGRRGFVVKSGTIDACRGEVVDLLEGGREAFELRRLRYERS